MAFVHVIANQKGGVGKTTLAVNLAAVTHQALAGDPDRSPVLVVSTDPQASAVWWSKRVGEQNLPFDFIQADDRPDVLRQYKDDPQFKFIFVDTPGSLENGHTLQTVLDCADHVVVPMPPEPMAFEPTRRTIEKAIKPRNLPYRVVLNAWDPRDGTADLDQTREFLKACDYPVANGVIRRYKLHTRASADGMVVTQYPANRVALAAAGDFLSLALELTATAGGVHNITSVRSVDLTDDAETAGVRR